MLPQIGLQATSIVFHSSSIRIMPPTTHKVVSKESSRARTEEVVEVIKITISIYADTQCFIDKSIEVTWNAIKDTFLHKSFVENFKDLQAYINIKQSRMHKIVYKFVVISHVEVIEWIITHMDDSHLVLRNESGGQLTTYYGDEIQTYYKMKRSTEYATNDFYTIWFDINTSDIIKSWCREPAKLLHCPSTIYLSMILRDVYQYLIVMCCRLHGQKNVEVFEET